MSKKSPASRSGTSQPFLLIGAGIAVFVVCSIVQAAGGTHMFSGSFPEPDSLILEFLIQVTWWPGWLATIALIGTGIWRWISRESQES